MSQPLPAPLTAVFDLDGTLVDTAPDLVRATNHVLDFIGAPAVTVPQLRVWVGSGARAMLVEGLRQAGGRFKTLAGADAEVDSLLERFLAYYEDNIAVESRAYDGTDEVLQRLRAEGVTLAVCTNKRQALSEKLLDALGLTNHFSAIAGRDTFPVYKPDPAHLTGAISLARGDPRRAVMIGDSETDILTARGAQIPIIAVNHGYTHRPVAEFSPDIVIDHFSELEAAIDRLAVARKDE